MPSCLFDLQGRTAYVTGGLGLIGRAVCDALGGCGATVIPLDIKENDAPSSSFVNFDASNTDNLAQKIEALENTSGLADIWVNCAYPRTEDWGMHAQNNLDPDCWVQNVNLQMNSYCLLASTIAERMAQRSNGSIINLGSIYGLVAADFSVYDGTDMTLPPAYAAIKGAIVNHTRYLASYYGSKGVRVNVVCPGGIANNQPARFVSNYEKRTPMRRLAKAEEIGGPVAFLASPAASYVTGAVLTVDGGWTAI
jgi:NAD(P)-dependent dehydrogenase (short-subunit alcohol dehydrogenase family)